MKNRKFWGRVALENEEAGAGPTEEVTTPEVPAEEVLETKAEVETGAAEVSEATMDVEQLQEAIEEGIDSGETLVDLGETVQGAIDQGEGLSPEAAKVTEIAIEHIRTRLDAPKELARIPAFENFKGAHSRLASTRIAMESIKNSIAEVWTRIAEFVKSVPEKVRNYLAGLVNHYATIEKHLGQLKSRAEAMEGTPAKDKLASKSAAKFLGDGTANGAKAKFDALNKKTEEVQALVKQADGLSLEPTAEGEAKLREIIKNAETLIKDEVFAGAEGEAGELAALDKAGVLALIAVLQAEVTRGKDIKDFEKNAAQAFKKVEDTAKKLAGAVDKIDEAKKTEMKDLSGLVKGYIKFLTKATSTIPGVHFNTVKAGADFAGACISNHKAAKAEGEAAAGAGDAGKGGDAGEGEKK